MSDSQAVELGPNDQETVEYPVEDDTDCVLVTMKSSEHNDLQTIPSWDIAGEEFPDETRDLNEYPARLEPLGDVLYLKVRNLTETDTTVTIGFREKKLIAS